MTFSLSANYCALALIAVHSCVAIQQGWEGSKHMHAQTKDSIPAAEAAVLSSVNSILVPRKQFNRILIYFYSSITLATLCSFIALLEGENQGELMLSVVFFPVSVITAVASCMPYLVKPSKFVRDEQNQYLPISQAFRSRPFSDMLVYTSGIYAVAAVYAAATGQGTFAFMLMCTCTGSTLYHLHFESHFFNLDNIFATTMLFVYLFSLGEGYRLDKIFFYFGVFTLPVAVFLIVSCGMPADVVVDEKHNSSALKDVAATGMSTKTAIETSEIESQSKERDIDEVASGVRTHRSRSKSPSRSAGGPGRKTNGASSNHSIEDAVQSMNSDLSRKGTGFLRNVEPVSAQQPGFRVPTIASGSTSLIALCCVDPRGGSDGRAEVVRKQRWMYDYIHMLWHLVSGAGPMLSVWLAYTYYYNDESSALYCGTGRTGHDFFMNWAIMERMGDGCEGVLGVGYFDPSTRCLPIIPIVCTGLSLLVNVLGNYYGVMPLD